MFKFKERKGVLLLSWFRMFLDLQVEEIGKAYFEIRVKLVIE